MLDSTGGRNRSFNGEGSLSVDHGRTANTITFEELQLGQEWERSYRKFDASLRAQTSAASLRTDDAMAPPSDNFESALPTAELQDLLELSEAGLGVAWPRGLDQRIARIILRQRTGMYYCDN